MIKTFTENDLVRFLYGEFTTRESEELEQALVTDTDLQSRLNDLQSVRNELDAVKLSPSKRTTNKILDFSKGYYKQSV